jgi:hypothetical protein
MAIADQIRAIVLDLPPETQQEALAYIEFLQKQSTEVDDWHVFSLESAMRGMEEEPMPEYTISDIKERFL